MEDCPVSEASDHDAFVGNETIDWLGLSSVPTHTISRSDIGRYSFVSEKIANNRAIKLSGMRWLGGGSKWTQTGGAADGSASLSIENPSQLEWRAGGTRTYIPLPSPMARNRAAAAVRTWAARAEDGDATDATDAMSCPCSGTLFSCATS